VDFLRSLHLEGIARHAGTAILVCPLGGIDVHAFMRFLLLVRGMPERVLLVRTHVACVPHQPVAEQARLTTLGHGMQLVDLRYGFDDDPDVPRALRRIARLALDPAATRYYVIDDRHPAQALRGWPRWRRRLFALMSAACVPAAEHFRLPADCTVEIRSCADAG